MDECHAEATRLLRDNMDKLTLIAETLKERETLQADEFLALMEGRSLEELDKKKAALLAEQKGMNKRKPVAAEQNEESEPEVETKAETEEQVQDVELAEAVQADAEPKERTAEEPVAAEAVEEEIPCISEESMVTSMDVAEKNKAE